MNMSQRKESSIVLVDSIKNSTFQAVSALIFEKLIAPFFIEENTEKMKMHQKTEAV